MLIRCRISREGFSSNLCMMGNPNAPVFPLPVSARPITSLPASATGMAFRWMRVGLLQPTAVVASTRAVCKPKAAQAGLPSSSSSSSSSFRPAPRRPPRPPRQRRPPARPRPRARARAPAPARPSPSSAGRRGAARRARAVAVVARHAPHRREDGAGDRARVFFRLAHELARRCGLALLLLFLLAGALRIHRCARSELNLSPSFCFFCQINRQPVNRLRPVSMR